MQVNDFDILVVGGGHAGVEAALAAARMGKRVGLISMDCSNLALMSCNPAIGGIGKSQLVKEVDALGGIMGLAADATGIQFRRLNLSRGPAVWSTRVQSDRIAYNKYISDFVAAKPGIELINGEVCEILSSGDSNREVRGVRLADGKKIKSSAVILTAGTFLGGLIHIGEKQIHSGRFGEPAAESLSKSLASFSLEIGRLKTGTPPRLNGDTIDWSRCEIQPGETPIPFLSPRSEKREFEQTPCYLTRTSKLTKEIVSANFNRSPIFSGQVESTGPRYCPSIEDKIYRFSDKPDHLLFLEPEGNGTNEIYPNGFSTALPEDVQLAAIRSVIGLEDVEITRPGYAVEYDYFPAHQIDPSLQCRKLSGLFLAGQVNGTSGYEEAAAQGIMAGINAVLWLEKEEPLILDRSQAYIGVMMDDLTTRSTTEPYRMFTSRAEYRLALREDNARDRLYEIANRYSLISKDEFKQFGKLQNMTNDVISIFGSMKLDIEEAKQFSSRLDSYQKVSIAKLVKQPDVTLSDLTTFLSTKLEFENITDEALMRASINVRYEGYIKKQEKEIERFKKNEKESLPAHFPYDDVTGLKIEACEKFKRFRPISLGQAGRIEGITAGDMAVLSVSLKKYKLTEGQTK